jgi:hypothetical protein
MSDLRRRCPFLVGLITKLVGSVRQNASVDVASAEPVADHALKERKIRRGVLMLACLLRIRNQKTMGWYVTTPSFSSRSSSHKCMHACIARAT